MGVKLYGSIQRRRDGLTFSHPELEEHTQPVVPLTHKYAFGGTDHFDPEEVMKISQILHFERCCKLALHAVDFLQVDTGDD
jgi:hypothetical protein